VSDRPTFFIDRCLGKIVAREMKSAGALVEVHDDHFAQAELDANWIPQVTTRGWIILTKDKNIRRASGERVTVLTANARIITLASGNMRGAEMAALFVGHLAELELLAVKQAPPFVAVLGRDGLHVVLPKPTPVLEEGESAGTT
jgi:predicted nuclease of predicted toxin-antitoxin system